MVLFCKNRQSKSMNYRLTWTIAKIYADNLSIEDIIEKRYEIDLLKTEFQKINAINFEEQLKEKIKTHVKAICSS